MAGDTSSQIWVTSALTDEDVPNALALCVSLRRQLTSRKVGVIVSFQVCPKLRKLLRQSFDCLFYFEEEQNTTCLKNEDFVKIFLLTLKAYDKLVYLSPTMMAIRNSDEIFQECTLPCTFLFTETGDMSIFVVEPSLEAFNALEWALCEKNGKSFESCINFWANNQSGAVCKTLDEKYNRVLSSKTGFLLADELDVSIVNLMNISLEANAENFGVLAKMVINNWKMIHNQDVRPLLESVRNTETLPISGISHSQPRYKKEPIAVVGMSCRYPSANNLEEFWSLLLNGEDGTGTPPDFRWLPQNSSRNSGEYRQTNAGFLKYPVEDFDSKFFGISPKEVVFLDPQHRLLHEIVWEGLEDAAIDPHSLEGTNGGVFIGSWLNEYKEILNLGGNTEFYRTYMGTSIGSGAARISHLLGLTGPCIATESGCSSAMVAVHLACKSLQRGETNMGIAAGVNLLLHPFDKDIMPMVVSPDGHSKTFDEKANGYGRAEGCGVLVLKRLSDAVRDGDKVWALIRGSAMTQEGISKSMGTPTIHCESQAMTKALQDARVSPEQVSYIEAHGTGTMVGDPLEVAAIAKAYHSSHREEPLYIGSVKTNVGHTESCSGITGIMKVVLSLQNETIPPHINFETINPSIDVDSVPAKIPLKPVAWQRREGKPRLAGVSSFGVTGTDAHVIIEETPSLSPNPFSSEMERPFHLMKISAKTEEALNILVEKYKNHLSSTNIHFKHLSHTANVGRSDFSQRAVIIAESNEDAVLNIRENKYLCGQESTGQGPHKLCFLFTGQGSQYPGMAKQLYQTSPTFRMHFEYCESILKNEYNIHIAPVLWADNPKGNEVSRTIYSQTSIFCVEYALLKLWESWGVKPDYALGHSLGEFAAAVCAGILSVEDALKLVAERSRLIDQLPRGKMLVVKETARKVESLMQNFAQNDSNKVLDFAAINSKEQTVLAGDSDVVLEFAQFCKENNIKCIVLEATHAFHSKHMNPVLDDYRVVARTTKNMKGNDCVYISGMKGTCVEAQHVDAEYWVEHTREKVLFLSASKKAVEAGCNIFIEIGPQPVLSALTMINNDTSLMCLPSLKRNEKEWETLLNSLGRLYIRGLKIEWKGLDQFYDRKKARVPHYPFIGTKYWPEMLAETGVSIHPLLGSVVPNASTTKLFNSSLSLNALEYVKDHAIGSTIIFPGAGYLELCLAAGLATTEGSTDSLSPPTRAMKVENLNIEAPLSLQEAVACQLQTVTEPITNNEGDWDGISIKVFKRIVAEASKWQPHARATFSPVLTPEEKHVVFDTNSFLRTLETPPEDEDGVKQVYDKLASVGLKFGPAFKSIEKVWRDEEKGTLLAKVKAPPQENNYIVHPVILDAMIQAIMMLRISSNIKKSLYVPIKIGKFVWLPGANQSSDVYIHAYGNGSAILVDAEGKVISEMSSVELVDTTVKALESVLEQQLSSMPECWEEVWRKTPSSLDHPAEMERAKGKYYTDDFHQQFENTYNIPSEHLSETFNRLEKLVYLNILRALYEIGWKPEVTEVFSESTLFLQLGIVGEFRKYFSFICDVLESEGILKEDSKTKTLWTVITMPPTLEKVLTLLSSASLGSDLIHRFEPTMLLQVVGENLSSLLSGSKSAISLLFPDDKEKTYPSISNFYDQYGQLINAAQVEKVGDLVLGHIVNSQTSPEVVFHVLEVGSGTGACTEKAIKILEATGTKFEYTYTDISPAFFHAAEKRFEKHLGSIKFKKLNIEEDPLTQGFTPEYFDVVIAAEVIHATKDIAESLKNLNLLMKPWGRLNIQETTKVNRVHAFSFGTLEGYWRFQDVELRQKYCVLEKGLWAQQLNANGFEVDGVFSVFDNDHSYFSAIKTAPNINQEVRNLWLLFHEPNHPISNQLKEKIEQVPGRRVITITEGHKFHEDIRNDSFLIRKREYVDFLELLNRLTTRRVEIEGVVYCWALAKKATAQEDLLQPYFNLTKSLLSLNITARLSLITSGAVPLEDGDLSSFHASTLWGYTKSMKNENFHLNCKCIELADEQMDEQRMQQVFQELWSSHKETQVGFYGSSRLIPKFQRHKVTRSSLKLPPGADRYQLLLPETKTISDLQFGPLDTKIMKENEVEIQIKVSALNFRDVLSIIKPSDDFKNVNTVGFDFSGLIKRTGDKVTKWKVGDRVYGCNVHFEAMPSHIVLPEDFILPLEEHLSYCEGATIPAVYMTSMMCLIDIAKIRKDDIVLIHTASGGVGLSAIKICKEIGCKIIVTAGSKRKQNYLRSLGIEHIFHSRNTQYGDQILELTKGRGVDVVMNSLTSEGFKETTLRASAKGARFVEMSKLNIWKEEDVAKIRPDIKYTTIDLTQLAKPEWIRLLHSLASPFGKRVVKPIPYVRFDALNIKLALEYMQKAKHIGKIVCTLPERQPGRTYQPMFNEQSSYLITGGLGGIGFVVAEWMLSKGAKHVVLAGRSPPNSSTQSKISSLNSRGANLLPVQLDVGNFEECRQLLENYLPKQGLPPLKGVMHAAGILSDGLIVNQEWNKLRATFDTKVNGSLNLHELTKELNLEHFVLFSSVVALLGTSGQSNHAAANSFEDALAHYRNSMGLPATTINWGQWGQVGVAKEIDLPGLKVLSNLQGVAGLEYAMNTQRLQTSIVNVESFVVLSKIIPQLPMYLDEFVWKASSGTSSVALKSDDFWQQYDTKTVLEEKVALLRKVLQIILKNVLKLGERDIIDDSANLQEMGVDSLMFVEIKNLVQSLMGERLVLNASSIKDCNTVNLLAETLVKLIEGKEEIVKPTFEQVKTLMREDCFLPEHISAKEGQRIAGVSKVKTVLLTGSTGFLGPYILKRLTQLSQISRVICLIRPHQKESEDGRLKKALETSALRVDMSKVQCVPGNLREYRFGMTPKMWDELCESVDAVINCAASVEHTEQYVKREGQNDSRAVNILGTKNVLEFACENRLKHVYHASSVAGVATIDDGRLSERWPELGEFDDLMTFAYPISKYVGDMLMKQAVERGIPCKVFRLPYMMGESETGRCSIRNNHTLMRYMFMMKNGIMPSTPVPMVMLPVDVCADVSLQLFFEEDAGPDIYNIHHARPGVDQEFGDVAAKLGYKVDFVEHSEFSRRVQEPGSALEIFKEFYSDENGIMGIFSGAPILQKWIEEGCQSNDMWFSKKVAHFIPDFVENQQPTIEYIYKDLLFCKSQGWFEKFGL